MKIVDNSKGHKTFSFLQKSDIFKLVGQSEIWMKTNSLAYSNAVCLSSGLQGLFQDNAEVIGPLNAELHIL